MRRWLVPLLLLLSLGTLVWVQAFSRGEVTGGGTVTVVSSSNALLAVRPSCTAPCPNNQTGMAYISGSKLILDFKKGMDSGVSYGFQPGSSYVIRNLVEIQNQAGRQVTVSATVSTGGSELTGVLSGATDLLSGSVTLANNATTLLSFEWTPGFTTGAKNLVLEITAQ